MTVPFAANLQLELGKPYAFSNNVRPHLKAPDFEECKFTTEGKGTTITIRLAK